MVKIKAYLQTFNDYELLKEALSSIYGIVDELIVVDGCYSWLESYYSRLGVNPERSCDELYDIVEQSRIPYRSIAGVWSTQIDKRIAGYESADAEYVIRFDSDELLQFDAPEIERFLASAKSVAFMEMPTFVTPTVAVSGKEGQYPTQNFIFKRADISATNHLEYMWLVKTVDTIGGVYDPMQVYEKPVAFNSHLTCWRSIKTCSSRALYYNTNWMRKHGFYHIEQYRDVEFKREDFERFFNQFGHERFQRFLLTDKVTISMDDIVNQSVLEPISVGAEGLEHLYIRYLDSYSSLLPSDLSFVFVNDREMFFDITTEKARDLLFSGGVLSAEVSSVIKEAHGYALYVDSDLNYKKEYLSCKRDGKFIELYMATELQSEISRAVRAVLSLTIECNSQDISNCFRILAEVKDAE